MPGNPQFDAALQRATTYLEEFAQRLNESSSALARGGGGGFGGFRAPSGGGAGGGSPLSGLAGSIGGAKFGAAGIAFDLLDRTVGFAFNAAKRQASQFVKRTAFGTAENLTFSAISEHGVSNIASLGNAAQEAARKVPFLGFAFNRRLDPIDRAENRTTGQLSAFVRAGAYDKADGTLDAERLKADYRDQFNVKVKQEQKFQELKEIGKQVRVEAGLEAQDDINKDLNKLAEAVKQGMTAALKESFLLANAPLTSSSFQYAAGSIK